VPVLLAGCLALVGGGCGGGSTGRGSAETVEKDEANASRRPGSQGAGVAAGDDAELRGLLDDLPGLDGAGRRGDVPPEVEGPPPRVTSLPEAEAAFRTGHHAPARAWLERVADPSGDDRARQAAWLLARLELATGRYDEARARGAALAEGAPAPAEQARALTLTGEADLRRGRLEAAERSLRRAIAADPNAFRAQVFLGRLLDRRGRRLEARPAFLELIGAYNDRRIDGRDAAGLTYVAMAARGLGSPQDANDAFREATRADPDRVETQLEWARLFLSKYDAGNAETSVREALRRNPGSALAHALMARIRIAQSFDFEAASAYLDRALSIDPKLVPAHVTRAGIALRERDFAGAHGHLDRALAVDPNDLEALSVRAAVRFVEDDRDGFDAAERAVLSRHPSYGEMYTTIADYADWEHRYPDIVDLARKAVLLDPSDGLAHATLGLNLLRVGDEAAGLAALREAWRRDRFNVQVFNTLEFYDDVVPVAYEDLDAAPFKLRVHREERAVLEAFVPGHLRAAWQAMVSRYAFTPEGPVRVELYADPEHFSVRTAGLPRIGVQGVCFGKVVTALSPRGGPFNWGEITWHELAHVFHIQLSDHRVPRWFTEGLAEWETGQARPEWKREDDHRLQAALDAGRLPPIGLLNRAFTQARGPEDATLAYYASTQAVTYLIEAHGFSVIPRMLKAWAAGKETDRVVAEVVGVDLDALDQGFRSWLAARLAPRAAEVRIDLRRFRDLPQRAAAARAAPEDAAAQSAHAAALLLAGEAEKAVERANAALALDPGDPTARVLLARLALDRGDGPSARRQLDALLQAGRDGYELRLLQARAAAATRDAAGVRGALDAATALDPDRGEAWAGLADLARRNRDDALLRRALSRLVDIDQHDRSAHHALLEVLVTEGAWDPAGDLAERMIFLDPHDPRVHLALGAARLAGGDGSPPQQQARSALDALDRARGLGAPAGRVEPLRARALRALGRSDEAAEAEAAAAAATTDVDPRQPIPGGASGGGGARPPGGEEPGPPERP
jgi:tetratricopeptide (TPR) repeat protein